VKSIVLALDAMPLNDSVHWPADYNARLVGTAVVGALFREEEHNGSPLPYCAASTSCFEDGRRWRVHLPDAYWSDGVRLSVDHLLLAAERILTRPNRIVARFFLPADTEDRRQTVHAVDGQTLEFRFARPISFAPHVFTLPQFAPRRGGDSKPGAPALGPYRLAKRDRKALVLHKNDRSTSNRIETIEELVFLQLSNAEEVLAAYDEGLLDVTPTTSSGTKEIATHLAHPNRLSRDIAMFGYLEFGASLPAFRRSPRLRSALGSLFDRRQLADRLGGLIHPLWDQSRFRRLTDDPLCEAPTPGHRGTTGPAPHITAVEADGLRAAFGGCIEIAYADFAPNGDVVAELSEQLSSRLGVGVRTRPLTYHEFVKAAITSDHCLLYTLTAADFTHPAAIFSPWRSEGSLARSIAFGDRALDRRIDAAEACGDSIEEARLWEDVSERWLELMPRIPLLQVRANCLVSPRLKGVHLTPGGLIRFDHLA
jgi:ABC-type transport system substrate-binding protein